MSTPILNEDPSIATDLEALSGAVESICRLVDDLREERETLRQLLREAHDLVSAAYLGGVTVVDARDWLNAAAAWIER
jgi:hypothetical protein